MRSSAGPILIFVLVAVLAAAAEWISHRNPNPGRATAKAIVSGYRQQRTLDAQDAEDQDLTDDEESAGALWAKDHRPRTVLECPGDPPAFYKGCEQFLRLPAR